MKHQNNEYLEFIGLNNLKEKQFQQLQQFENWALLKEWANFHNSHYDTDITVLYIVILSVAKNLVFLQQKTITQILHFVQNDKLVISLSNYDWWMFPYNESSSHGFAYTIFEYETYVLQQDKDFMKNYLRGCELLLLSWGWDLYKSDFIQQTDELQCWQNWSIRLYKCARSLKQFGCHKEFESTKRYALILMSRGQKFSYNRTDLSWLFY